MCELFFNTIHKVNNRDYDQHQIAAWAPLDFDLNLAVEKIRQIEPFVAVADGKIIGYADIQSDGYIDHFYCHHEHQGQGVGRALFSALEAQARSSGTLQMYANVSITARPFFEAMGFSVEKEQRVTVRGQTLTNYRMVRMKIKPPVPILRSFDEMKAREFYVDFLEFSVDWEHRFSDDLPLYMQLSMGDCVIHLSEHHGDASPGAALRIEVDDLENYQKKLIGKQYKNARPGINEVPWGLEMPIGDPFGNRLIFCVISDD